MGGCMQKTYLAFALPVILFWGLQWLKNKQYFKLSVQQVFGFALILLFVSPLLTYIYNLLLWGNLSGPAQLIDHVSNKSLILGTIANFIRYTFEIFHFPFFVENTSLSSLGISPVNIINNCWINYVNPLFGSHGESSWSFQVNWEQLEDSWFGPIGFLLLLYFIYSFSKEAKTIKKR